ncbi:hypothetical protein CK203_063478 [Vitis vinifera]|uniref:Uncharacterized protein n=1 Tax=Vitis vinifera TaxID=29760 RepID=A0A438FRQ5_VITVI|nr:hypothetical protein CK203_063478 [Vitis vinifera]
MFRDQANVVGQFKPNNNAPYGNTYNSSWRNHPNFSWKARATQYQQPDQPSQQSSSLEQAIAISASHDWRKGSGESFVDLEASVNLLPYSCLQAIGTWLSEPPNVLATLQSWRRIEEILPLFNKEEEAAVEKETPKLNLKPLPVELKYTYLEENNQCPVVISSSLTSHQEKCLLEVLKSKANSSTSKKMNPHLQEVVRAEVLKLLTAALFTLYLTALGKDHFPLPFIDQVLERVSGHPFYCFLDGYLIRLMVA